MTAESFVDAIRDVVIATSATYAVETFQDPPGRSPAKEILAMSAWYKRLGKDDQVMVARIIELAARDAVFGVFAVLDGSARVGEIDGGTDYFELRHVHGSTVEILSGPKGSVLHELL